MWQPSLNELDHKIKFGMFLAKGSMVKHTLIKIGECLCFMKQPIAPSGADLKPVTNLRDLEVYISSYFQYTTPSGANLEPVTNLRDLREFLRKFENENLAIFAGNSH